jgi:uncharacterized protein YpmS
MKSVGSFRFMPWVFALLRYYAVMLVTVYWHSGTACRSHLQGSNNPEEFECMIIKDKNNLSRYVSKELTSQNSESLQYRDAKTSIEKPPE